MENNSAKTADKIFNYHDYENEDSMRNSFNEYFADMPDISDKPFECPNVRVLSKSIGIIFENRPSWKYNKGDLICIYGAKNGTSRRCRFGGLESRGTEFPPVTFKNKRLTFYCHISKIHVTTIILRSKYNSK